MKHNWTKLGWYLPKNKEGEKYILILKNCTIVKIDSNWIQNNLIYLQTDSL